jgi:hypothetical protein
VETFPKQKWDSAKFYVTLRHRGCGGELHFVAKVGEDRWHAVEVAALTCEVCERLVLSIEDKEEIEHEYVREDK